MNYFKCLEIEQAEPQQAEPVQANFPEEKLQEVAKCIGNKCHVWEGIGARDVEEVLRQALRLGLVTPQQAEPVAWMYTGIKHDGTTHGPHLVWSPFYMDAMSAEKGALAIPLYAAPQQQAEPPAIFKHSTEKKQ
jgi:hypothetical protein